VRAPVAAPWNRCDLRTAPRTWQLKVSDLAGASPPYLFKGLDDDDSAWNLVRERPIGRLVPSPDKDGFLPEEVTVRFADGTVRVFNPADQVMIGPTIAQGRGRRG
jgi:hypothetical protein